MAQGGGIELFNLRKSRKKKMALLPVGSVMKKLMGLVEMSVGGALRWQSSQCRVEVYVCRGSSRNGRRSSSSSCSSSSSRWSLRRWDVGFHLRC